MNEFENLPLTKKQRRELKRQKRLEQRKREATKRKTIQIVVWAVIILAIGGGVYALTQGDTQSNSNTADIISTSDTDWVKGNTNSDVVLIEYSDFQCPACASYSAMFKQLAEDLGDSAKFVYRHYPLHSIHSNAQLAAQAAEAAGLQGKFWEMHDKLFAGQSEWSGQPDPTSVFVSYAESLELNKEQFKSDLTLAAVKDKVDNDYKSATQAGLNSTPSFILNGEKIDNPRSLDEFKELLLGKIE